MTPSARSRQLLIREGHVVETVERWIPGRHVRLDAFGVGDLLACREGDLGPLLVQVTTKDHQANRMAKAASASPDCGRWLACGGRFEVHGWGRIVRGKRRLWDVTRRAVLLSDLAGAGDQMNGPADAVPLPNAGGDPCLTHPNPSTNSARRCHVPVPPSSAPSGATTCRRGDVCPGGRSPAFRSGLSERVRPFFGDYRRHRRGYGPRGTTDTKPTL